MNKIVKLNERTDSISTFLSFPFPKRWETAPTVIDYNGRTFVYCGIERYRDGKPTEYRYTEEVPVKLRCEHDYQRAPTRVGMCVDYECRWCGDTYEKDVS